VWEGVRASGTGVGRRAGIQDRVWEGMPVAGIELRMTPSIWPFWRRVANSTVEFSGSRLRNSAAHPDQLG